MFFDEGEQGTHDLHLGDGDDLVEVTAAERERECACRAYGAAISNGIGRREGDGVSAGECCFHAGGIFRLNADDLHLWVDGFCPEGNAGGKSAAADGDKDGIYVFECVDHLKGDRALSNDDVAVVEWMDVDVAMLFLQFEAVCIGVVESVAVKYNGRAECPCRLHL